MRYQLLATLAAAFTLAGCESTTCEQKSGTYDWPAPVQNTEESPVVTTSTSEDFMKSCKDRVFFDLNKSGVKATDLSVVDAQADWFAKNASVNATIEGHCDQRGTTEYNLALGERRAHALKKALISKGVAADRLNTVSYGKERPDNTGENESAYAENRRAVTVVQ